MPELANVKIRANLAFDEGDRVADRYIVRARIGRGGMGAVYRAYDTLINEEVALKFMNPQLLHTEKGWQLFIQEAQVARRLRHENIVAVHDVSSTPDGVLYLSMELLEGQSLRAYLRQRRKERRLVEVRLAVTVIKQVLAALEYAHRTVIHRDIKPENIMVLAGERVKVLDFGLAKAVLEEYMQDHQDENAPKRVVGTLAYAAPEQRMMRSVDLRADLYAVGMVFLEMLTLRTPLDEPVKLAAVRDDISPSLARVLDRALAPEKEGRYQSAGEFRDELEKAFEGSYRVALVEPEQRGDREVSTEGMVFLEGGSFLMGSNDVREEAPEEEVYVEPFWIDEVPVTVEQYARFLEETGYAAPKYWRDAQYNGPRQPVVGVTWHDARAYAHWAGKELPTEAQWEFAARGKDNRRYPWGNLPPEPTLCNFGEYLGMTSIVTMHEEGRTPDGVYDMAGNVMEWTLDPYAPYTAIRKAKNGPINAPRRALRGGCWSSRPEELCCTRRKGLFPEAQLATVGFRCALTAGRK